jgi:hypothetical protein
MLFQILQNIKYYINWVIDIIFDLFNYVITDSSPVDCLLNTLCFNSWNVFMVFWFFYLFLFEKVLKHHNITCYIGFVSILLGLWAIHSFIATCLIYLFFGWKFTLFQAYIVFSLGFPQVIWGYPQFYWLLIVYMCIYATSIFYFLYQVYEFVTKKKEEN